MSKLDSSERVGLASNHHDYSELHASGQSGCFPNKNEPLIDINETQSKLMDKMCILVDENDNQIGVASKQYCHLTSNIDNGALHRGFGVYLFDSQNRLLLQQRASEKITFPNVWSNSCCSHPLDIASERGSDLRTSIEGVKRSAQKKLSHELGIRPGQIPISQIQFLTRLYYKASTDGPWGEHEIGYALLIIADVDVQLNPNEVQNIEYVTESDLKTMLDSQDIEFSPWFRLVCSLKLFGWWKHIKSGTIEHIVGDVEIHRME